MIHRMRIVKDRVATRYPWGVWCTGGAFVSCETWEDAMAWACAHLGGRL